MLHPNPSMLLRIAQADSYAAATEYIKAPRDKALHDAALQFICYLKHPTHSLRPGQYTDDTQMSIAVAETLIAQTLVHGQKFRCSYLTREAFADSFVRCFKRDRRDGYSRSFQQFLETVSTGGEFLDKINPTSDKNGAAMRSVPLGVLESPEEVALVAEVQAKITHDTPGGILSSQIVALVSHFALYSGSPMEPGAVAAFLSIMLPNKISQIATLLPRWDGRVTGPDIGMRTAHAVFDLVTSGKTLMGILRQTIEWGGDTDSVAAIAWGIASARDAEPVPDFLEHGLEPGGKYGVGFLKDLGAQLMAATATAAPSKI
jgi:ADP-ribosyl-[dinitrogen reductase] hydrolase